MIEIVDSGVVLARHISAGDAWSPGLNFFSADEEYVQVGTWGYDSGKLLKPHIHNLVSRNIGRTQEVVFVRAGRLRATIFGELGQMIDTIDAKAGDILILLAGGHGYEVLEEGTQVLEIKNGPYVGADADRRRI